MKWIVYGHSGFAGPHTGDQPAGELLSGIRTVDILHLTTLGPLSFVFLPFVGDRSQILGVRGTPQSTTDVTLDRYSGRRRGIWSGEKNTRTEMRSSLCCGSTRINPYLFGLKAIDGTHTHTHTHLLMTVTLKVSYVSLYISQVYCPLSAMVK